MSFVFVCSKMQINRTTRDRLRDDECQVLSLYKDAKFHKYFSFDASGSENEAWLHIMHSLNIPNYVTLDSVANI